MAPINGIELNGLFFPSKRPFPGFFSLLHVVDSMFHKTGVDVGNGNREDRLERES